VGSCLDLNIFSLGSGYKAIHSSGLEVHSEIRESLVLFSDGNM